MKAKLALILSFIIIVSTISYFSVINAATLSFFDDIDSSFTTNICGPTTVAQETISFILNDTGTEQTVQDDLSITDGNIHYIGPDEAPPAGHGWSNKWSIKTEPTCTQQGEEMMLCDGCNDICIRTLPALGHDSHMVTTPPTCTENGSQVTTCSRCDYSETKVIPALGHDLSTIVTEPNCITDGSEVTTCSRCDYSETKVIPALGHKWNHIVAEPTCTQEGSITTTCVFGDYQTTVILPKLETPVNFATSNQVSVLSESLVTQLQGLSSYMFSSLSTPSSPHGPNAVDAVFGTLSLGVIIAGGIILYPYFTLFQWVNKKKKAAIKNIFGGKTK